MHWKKFSLIDFHSREKANITDQEIIGSGENGFENLR